jgi:hypothetical protein
MATGSRVPCNFQNILRIYMQLGMYYVVLYHSIRHCPVSEICNFLPRIVAS